MYLSLIHISSTDSLTDDSAAGLYGQLVKLNALVEDEAYQPNIIYSGEEPKEFSCIPLTSYPDCTEKTYDSIFDVLKMCIRDSFQTDRSHITLMSHPLEA